MALIWNAPVGKATDLLEVSGKRELFWYGVTVGQVGFGVLVSRLRQPAKRVPDRVNSVVKKSLSVSVKKPSVARRGR